MHSRYIATVFNVNRPHILRIKHAHQCQQIAQHFSTANTNTHNHRWWRSILHLPCLNSHKYSCASNHSTLMGRPRAHHINACWLAPAKPHPRIAIEPPINGIQCKPASQPNHQPSVCCLRRSSCSCKTCQDDRPEGGIRRRPGPVGVGDLEIRRRLASARDRLASES